MIYLYYKTDGTFEKIERDTPLPYEDLSSLVGGLIEFAQDEDGTEYCINETGLIDNLPVNNFITPKYQANYHGNIIHGRTNEDGDFVGFEPFEVEENTRKLKTISPELCVVGKVFTIIGIGEFMAQTTRAEVKAVGSIGGKPAFKENKKGARKQFHLRNLTANDILIFEGKNLPFKIDGEVETISANGMKSRTIRGNALLNFVGDADTIRNYINEYNLNPFFTAYDRVNLIEKGDRETLLFPNRFASSKRVAELQEKQIKRDSGVDIKIGEGYQIL